MYTAWKLQSLNLKTLRKPSPDKLDSIINISNRSSILPDSTQFRELIISNLWNQAKIKGASLSRMLMLTLTLGTTTRKLSSASSSHRKDRRQVNQCFLEARLISDRVSLNHLERWLGCLMGSMTRSTGCPIQVVQSLLTLEIQATISLAQQSEEVSSQKITGSGTDRLTWVLIAISWLSTNNHTPSYDRALPTCWAGKLFTLESRASKSLRDKACSRVQTGTCLITPSFATCSQTKGVRSRCLLRAPSTRSSSLECFQRTSFWWSRKHPKLLALGTNLIYTCKTSQMSEYFASHLNLDIHFTRLVLLNVCPYI